MGPKAGDPGPSESLSAGGRESGGKRWKACGCWTGEEIVERRPQEKTALSPRHCFSIGGLLPALLSAFYSLLLYAAKGRMEEVLL